MGSVERPVEVTEWASRLVADAFHQPRPDVLLAGLSRVTDKKLTAPLVGGGFIVPAADASALRIVVILLGGVKPAALVSRALSAAASAVVGRQLSHGPADAAAPRPGVIILGRRKTGGSGQYGAAGVGRVFQKIGCSSRGVGSVMWSGLPQRMTV